MKEEYIKNFENCSNVELLKILAKPEEFEKEAIEVVNEILSKRNVLESETQEAQKYCDNLEFKKKSREQKIINYKKTIGELFQPIVSHGTDPSPSKWLNSFLVLIVIQFIWYLIEAISSFFTINDSFTNIYNSLILFYVIIAFYLLLKKKKWGWILLFAEKLFTVLISLFFLVVLMSNSYFAEFNLNEFIWPLIIGLSFLVFLWRQEIVSFFNITDIEKIKFAKQITYVVIFLGVLIITMAYNA